MLFALFSLNLSGFLSATILPGSSEVAFVAFLDYFHEYWSIALVSLTISNSLGSMTSYIIAHSIVHKQPSAKVIASIRRYGVPLLFFSFVPVVGDALPIAAGWLKMPAVTCLIFIAIGKFVRYCIILAGFSFFML